MGQGSRRLRRRVLGMAVEQLETRALLSDLFGSFLDAPAAAAPGSAVDVSYEVTNSGGPDTPSFHVNFYLSNNTAISGSDTLLGGADLSVAADSTTGHVIKSLTLPAANDPFWASVTGGTYHIGMLIDTGNTVAETEENNNGNQGQGLDRDSLVLPVDLFGDFFDAPPSAAPTNSIDVTYQLRNSGAAATPSFHVDWYLSADATINTGDVLLTGIDTTLAANTASGHLTQSLSLPGPNDAFWNTLTNGTFRVGMLIDTANTVAESNETNNSSRGVGLDLDSLTLAPVDLQGDFFDAPAASGPGNTIDVSYQVRNTSAGVPPTFHVSFYLSDNSTITASDTLLGGADLNLGANIATGHLTKSLTLPAAGDPFWHGIVNGTYFIGMIIDTGSTVSESNEANNSNRGQALDRDSIVIDGTAPTATLTPVTAPTSGANAGFIVTFGDNVLVKASSIGSGDIRVTGPNGYSELATPFALPSQDSNSIIVTYIIPAPDGVWDFSDNGTYTISMVSSEVTDTGTTPVAAGSIGTFTVNIAANPPTIASLTGGPDPVTRPSDLTLIAPTVAGGASAISKVEFYRDSNKNGFLDLGIDTLLGSDSDPAGGWTVTTSTLGFALGSNRYFARVQNADGFWSNVVSTTGTANNKNPTIETLSATPSPVTRGTDYTLTANNTIDADGSIAKVEFYRDVNGNGTLEIGTDILLGTDTSSAGGWTFTGSSVALAAAANKFLAVATDNDGAASAIATTTLTAVNANPVIGSLTDSPDPVLHKDQISLTANGLSDVDGTIAKVDFYRDTNGNGVLDVDTDALLGTDTTSGDGWTFTGSAAAFPVGAITYFARAQDNLGGFTVASASGTVEPLSIAPDPVTRGQNITLTANGLGNTTAKVEFYRDSNNNGVLDVDTDALLGTDSTSGDGWTWINSTTSFSAGTNTYFARALDSQDVVLSTATITGTVTNILPTIGSLTHSTDPVTRGTDITLSAITVSDADGTIVKVEFYRDSNDNGVFDAATDVLLGTDSDSIPGWIFTGPSVNFKIGTNRFFARATDSDGGVSNVVTTTMIVTAANPVIASLSITPDPVVRGQNITLTANGVNDADGSIAKVEFYRDTNGNGTLEVGTDALLGSDTNLAGGFTFTGSSAAFKIGTNRFFARATDNDGGVSNVVTTTLVANNATPVIGSLSDSPDPVFRAQSVTLTANTVTDADGTIAKVEFYRDANGNGTLEVGTDILLGSDTSSAGGWTFTGSAAALPFGPITYIARATDNDGGLSSVVTASGVVEPLSITPASVTRGQNITLTANGLGNTTVKVEFYRDSNNNGILDLATDALLGTDSDPVGGWTWTNSTTGFSAGSNKYFARADDDLNAWGTITGTVSNIVPTIVSLGTDAPNPVIRGANITLTANTVNDTDGTIAKVEFYRDSNGNGTLEVGTDILLGSDTDSTGGRTFTGSSAAFQVGANKLFARATDNDGGISTSVNTTITASNANPVVESLSDAPDPVVRGVNITLTANNLIDADGTIAKVEFYRDANGNGTLEVGTDILLGSDSSSAGGFTFTFSSVALPVGAITYLARAQDNNGAFSAVVSTTGTINNALPVIGSLSASPNPIDRGKTLTLTANNVSDADGPITKVEFYLDVNGNGTLEVGTDTLLGSDTSSTGGWTWAGSTAAFTLGVKHFLARATDNLSAVSSLATAIATVNDAAPVIGSLTAQPSLLLPGQGLTLTANGVLDDEQISKVEFYRDINNNGQLDLAGANPDVLLGADMTVADGWTWNFATDGLPVGNYGFLARAVDNNNALSQNAKVNTTIANPCAIGGVIFNDTNGNGRKNTGEKPLSGWRVYFDENNNKRFDAGERSVRTDTKGRWSLTPLHFGTNRIRYVAPTGWKATTPGALTFKLTSGSCVAAQLFGVKKI